MLSKSYALYETKKEYNVIKGTVPDFGYDVKLAVVVDGEKKEEIPNSPIGQDNKYYEVQVDCTSSKTSGLWDYNAWRLNLDYIESNSKCNLTFTSSMSKEEYDEYIKSGVALRRNTYRGKDITDLWKSEDLYKQIENGTFADIFVGDYIVSDKKDASNKKIVWLIADIDNYLYQGDQALTKHHVTVIPAYKLEDGRMNATATTESGYAGSEMVTSTLNNVLTTYIEPDFKDKSGKSHIIEYRNIVSTSAKNGQANSWEWQNRKLDLMSEVNVYGTTIVSSSLYDVGIDSQQYAIFRLKPELKNESYYNGNRQSYWLKAVGNSSDFSVASSYGDIGRAIANNESGVRPRFLIG